MHLISSEVPLISSEVHLIFDVVPLISSEVHLIFDVVPLISSEVHLISRGAVVQTPPPQHATRPMRVFVLGSGSTGNLAVVEADDGDRGPARVIIDAGLNPTAAAVRMRALGADLFPRGALAVVVTHHHGDHIAQAQPLARALRAPLFMHAGVEASRLRARLEVRPYAPGTPFLVGPFEIETLAVPHDAPQVAVRVACGARSFGYCTDLGHAPPALAPFLGRCDVALVEANYCPRMLEVGPYPPRVRSRVSGPLGHLANEQTAELAARLVGTRLGRLLLGHLSRDNNTPARALEVVRARAPALEIDVVPHGASRVFAVERRPGAPAEQLGLPFHATAS